ncbi:unnamed protein product [Phytophthora fragariaefolia]|uniref:Unnamed protein product n=1 Tax=Phytophthora fragariaefolia TaxID=1490495 RepID=A0A9W6Y3G5_9STRA|nr:unnamed protein product [Phytophthora fragariaefolia]
MKNDLEQQWELRKSGTTRDSTWWKADDGSDVIGQDSMFSNMGRLTLTMNEQTEHQANEVAFRLSNTSDLSTAAGSGKTLLLRKPCNRNASVRMLSRQNEAARWYCLGPKIALTCQFSALGTRRHVATPQQNVLAECMKRSLEEMVRCMLYHEGIDKKWWAEAINTAAWVDNRIPNSVNVKTPYEIVHRTKPQLKNMKVFGSLCYAHIPDEKCRKLDPKAFKCRFMGFKDGVKGYRVLDVATGKVQNVRTIKFMETTDPDQLMNRLEMDENEEASDLEDRPAFLPPLVPMGQLILRMGGTKKASGCTIMDSGQASKVMLSHWDITVRKDQRDEEGVAPIMAAGIIPREHLDEVEKSFIPAKGRIRKPPVLSVEMLDDSYQGIVFSFNKAVKTSIRRVRKKFQTLRLVHAKRECNQADDYMTLKTLTLGKSWIVRDPEERVSKIADNLMKPKAVLLAGEPPQDSERLGLPQGPQGSVGFADSQSAPLPHAARVFAVLTRSKTRARTRPNPEVVEDVPPDEAKPRRPMTLGVPGRTMETHPDPSRARYISVGNDVVSERRHRGFSLRRLRKISKVADLFTLDSRDVLYRLAHSTRGRPRNFVDEPGLVIPYSLRSDMLHYAHEDLQAQVARDGHRISPRNIEPRRPFEVVSMDFITHMPESERGNTFQLLFQDAFSCFLMCKPMRSSTAQVVADVYEVCVFRRFGASFMVRHDQDPRFMSDVFTRFRAILGSNQRATLAYRRQANDQQERPVETVVWGIRAYIAEADKSDWDDHAERLMFALNTSFDATRLDTPFYLDHGWDAQGMLSAMLGPRSSRFRERTAFE